VASDQRARSGKKQQWQNRRPQPLADLIGAALTPLCRRRGFATADLVTAWSDIVGERYADTTQAEKLIWPRNGEDDGDDYASATLVVRCEGPTALFLQHDAPQIIERINVFLGWAAIGRLKIIQRPLVHRAVTKPKPLRPLTADEERELAASLSGVDNPHLKAALERLGRAVQGTQPK